MVKEEFEDKLIDLIDEYINNGEDLDLDKKCTVRTTFGTEKYEVDVNLKFEIMQEK